MSTLWADLETYSTIPINNGTHAYAAESEILLFAYALDDAPAKVWDATQNPLMPDDLCDAIEDPAVLLNFHNVHFDRTILAHNGHPLPITRFRDTMVKAMVHSLPGSLGGLCEILGVPTDKAKDKKGKELVHLFTKPRPKTSKIERATRETHPKEWADFVEYARLDVEAMRAVDKKLPKWNYEGRELALWHLDQEINTRGFQVDTDLARAAIRAVNRAQETLAKRTQEITQYDSETGAGVRSATQRDALLRYLVELHGVELPDMKASTLERRVTDENLPPMLRELLAIRLQASTSSTSKYKTVLAAVAKDGRLKGTLQFAGALRTARWAGRMFQPQNLPRPDMDQEEIDFGVEVMKADAEDLFFDNVMRLTSNTIRGVIVAPPGKKLVVADLSNIEGRVLAWLAGEHWKLQAFYDFDAGIGFDLYALAYAKSFNINPQVVIDNKKYGDGSMRQAGKVQELALGYQGGVGAFLTFATAYNLDLEAMAVEALDNIPEEILEESQGFLKWLCQGQEKLHTVRVASGLDPARSLETYAEACKKIRLGLSVNAFLVCDVFKRMWRYAHPEIATWWRELEDAARTAISQPGKIVPCRRVKFIRTGAWLRIQLPSGRNLCYPSPQIGGKCAHCAGEGKLEIEGVIQDCPACDGEATARANQISYMGINQYSRKWSRISTYGGKIAENITQAVARDVLAYSFPEIEGAGYSIVLTVHDEDITEAPDLPEYNAEHLAALMSTNPPWAKGLPLAAAGFEGYRYRKE